MNRRAIFGTVLMLLGAFMFLNRGASFGVGTIFGHFWPSLFVIPVGLFFHWLYFSMIRKGVGLLIPGGIIFTTGLVCQLAVLFGGWSYMWPGFIFAVAVGLFEFYWFGSRNRWLMIPIGILTVLSLLFFAVFSIGTLFFSHIVGQPVIAVLMIVVGALALFRQKKRV